MHLMQALAGLFMAAKEAMKPASSMIVVHDEKVPRRKR